MKLLTLLTILLLLPAGMQGQEVRKLSGQVIGTALSVDYSTNRSSSTVNTVACAFDGDPKTYFAAYQRSLGWAGLDLGKQYVIRRVGWMPRNDSQGPQRVQLALFEGSNNADFLDAVPLYIVPASGTIGQMEYAEVSVTRPFRYVRYVGPNDARCNVAEVEFYGNEADMDDTMTADQEERLYQLTNLPTVTIHIKNNAEPNNKYAEHPAYVSIISRDGYKVLYDTCTIRLRGNASMDFPKKPYRIKFDQKHHVLGSPAKAKKWTLINNYGDKTLMRNLLAFDLSRRMEMPYTPFGTAVDLIVNGEYRGCYQLCDQVEVHKGRVEIDEMDADCVSGDELTGGYFVEIDAYADSEPVWFKSGRQNPVTIKSPDSEDILNEQKDYIKKHFNTMEAALFSPNFRNEEFGYRRYLDLETFLRHFLVGELSGNTDTYWSTYMYKQRMDDKFYTGPVWDFDLAFDNDNRTYPLCNLSDYVYASRGSYAGHMREFVNRIIKQDPDAQEQLKGLWAELRMSHAICADSLTAYVDQLESELGASQKLNFTRWKIMNQWVHQNPKVWGSYAAEVRNVRDYIKRRIDWMDRKLSFDPERLGIESTSIDAVTADVPIYDLMGRRHAELQPGINVRDGKKIIVR